MRSAVGGIWLYGMVITFILFFVAFLAITANYTKAYRVKNEVVSFIEREEGMTNRSVGLINGYLQSNAHFAKGSCDTDKGWAGVWDLNSTGSAGLDINPGGKKYYYCIRKMKVKDDPLHPNKVYYEVKLFFAFDIPVLGSFLNMNVYGTTGQIVNPAKEDKLVPGN